MNAMIEALAAKIRLIVGRCVIFATRYESGQMNVDVEMGADEKRRDLDLLQQFGFISRPMGKVSGLALFVGGSRSNGAVVACNGEDSSMKMSLEKGEVCMLSPYGQKIYLKKDGSVLVQSGNGVIDFDGEIRATKEIHAWYGKPNAVKLSTHIHGTGTGPSSPPNPGS